MVVGQMWGFSGEKQAYSGECDAAEVPLADIISGVSTDGESAQIPANRYEEVGRSLPVVSEREQFNMTISTERKIEMIC